MSLFTDFKKGLMKVGTFSSTATVQEKLHLADEDYQGITQKTRQQTVLRRNIEKVTHIDEKIIELVLKSETIKVEPTAGFLIEVFASGSDGRLQRLFKDDLVDARGKVVEDGFSDYIVMEIDTE